MPAISFLVLSWPLMRFNIVVRSVFFLVVLTVSLGRTGAAVITVNLTRLGRVLIKQQAQGGQGETTHLSLGGLDYRTDKRFTSQVFPYTAAVC